jgi:hypothetical protein
MKAMQNRRTVPRRKFSYYMRVLDDDTEETLGHLVDIGALGFRIESTMRLPIEKQYFLRVELHSEVADKPFMVFSARTKWIQPDHIHPNLFQCGFEIVEMLPEDKEIFQRILERYGAQK